MILVDYSQLAISMFIKTPDILRDDNSLSLSRHMILNMIRAYNKKYRKQYGNLVLCVDSGNVWRREIFPQYKQLRRDSREKSDFDWGKVFLHMATILEEIKKFAPFSAVQIDRLEADDIIGIIIMESSKDITNTEKHLIISSDKDHLQLQVYGNVNQYSPLLKKMINKDLSYKQVHREIISQYINGDKGDGIPNVYSDDNVFVEGRRQKCVTKKKLDEIFKYDSVKEEYLKTVLGEHFQNYLRNKKLISYEEIPVQYWEMVMNQLNEQKRKDKTKFFNYLITAKCSRLIGDIGDFNER